MKKVLLKKYKNHVEGYGIASDLTEGTIYGISKRIINRYDNIVTVFEVDPKLDKYILDVLNVPKQELNRGTLYVYGIIV